MTSDESSSRPDPPEGISVTTIYPTIAAAFEEYTGQNWFREYSPAARHNIKCTFYTAVAEAMRLIAYRCNADQNFSIFTELENELNEADKVIVAETLELHRAHGGTVN